MFTRCSLETNLRRTTVTFNAASGLLDGYDVKKDLIADADITAPVEAVGKTRFTISPKHALPKATSW